MLALFTGTHTNKVDKKGRVSVPAPFRATLSAQGFEGAWLFPNFTGARCIEGCGAEFMKKLAAKIEESADPFSETEDDYTSLVFAESQQVAFDPEGRIIIPKTFMEFAGITERASFVGTANRFQIWEPEAREAYMAEKRAARAKTPPRLSARPAEGGMA
ncbi:division/cell wall cluster transcriptional repressor MraZ [Caenispirillum salinarum]|uniref:division/cell wall cluster transcriptional repressor MraZ n=1 Tax=Caenispirillum salinarum TaxID=859058 RepID=UPI0038509C80